MTAGLGRKLFFNSIFILITFCAVSVLLLSQQHQWLGWQAFVVRSGSMAPTIPTGSLIFSQNQKSYTLGDVVTFQREPGTLITHRIVDISSVNGTIQYSTQGDANPTADTSVVEGSFVIGKTQFFVPYIGFVFGFLQSPLGVIFFIVIPGTLLIYENVKLLHRNFRQLFLGSMSISVGVLLLISIFSVNSTWAVYSNNTSVQSLGFQTGQWVAPSLQLHQHQSNLVANLTTIGGSDQVSYHLSYTHLVDGATVQEEVTGEYLKELPVESVQLPEIFLGTCSSENVCTAHLGIQNVSLNVLLKKQGNVLNSLQNTLVWSE